MSSAGIVYFMGGPYDAMKKRYELIPDREIVIRALEVPDGAAVLSWSKPGDVRPAVVTDHVYRLFRHGGDVWAAVHERIRQ
jgi:hypothetical protein